MSDVPIPKRQRTWLEMSDITAKAAQHAYDAGDMEAFVDLISYSAQCVQLARLLDAKPAIRRGTP